MDFNVFDNRQKFLVTINYDKRTMERLLKLKLAPLIPITKLHTTKIKFLQYGK